jgi:hypothetical protein
MQPNKSSTSRFLNGAAPVSEENFVDRVSSCAEIDFGIVKLSDGEKVFCRQLNKEILLLCKSMPESTQIDALTFLMGYAGVSFDQEINFFKNYYAPAWSVIYWLIHSCPDDKKLANKDINNAISAHAMAMFLHSIDDHLNDGQISVNHLSLLLRSQAWMRMNNALGNLTDGVDDGHEIVKGFIDEYYTGICGSEKIESLDRYCERFRKQMATWLIVPVLITKKIADDTDFTHSIQSAYESFGIAWRLLDDLQDIEKDMIKGTHSAIYYSLFENIKNLWDKKTEAKSDDSSEYPKTILEFVLENSVINRIKERICSELESAAAVADSYNMADLKNEFYSLLQPLKKTPNPL